MSYKYRLVISNKNGIIIKRFMGNDCDVLTERFEMWAIKSGYDRYEMIKHFEYVQHVNY